MAGMDQVQLAFLGGLGPTELVVIFLIVLLVFGAKRIPEIAQGLGKGITEFKKAARDITDEFDVNNTTASSSNYPKNELKAQKPAAAPKQPAKQSQKTES